MPANNVNWPLPLTRLNPFYPGQFGVPGTANETGLRQHSSGAIFYVDPNHVDNNDNRDGTDPTSPLSTVAAAILKCQPYRGDVIAVMANNSWQYGNSADGFATAISEEVIVTVPGIKIVGVCPSGQGVYWYPVSNAGVCITVHAIDVTIEGFFFSEGSFAGCTAIESEWDGATLFGENLTVRNCVFDDTVDIAIQLDYSWYCDIHDNIFWKCDTYGIYSPVAGSGIAFSRICDNDFHDCAIAISLLGGCDDNIIQRNTIYNSNAQTPAAATDEGIDTTGGARNMVSDNYFSCALPAPAAGDYDDLNTAAATDAWINNHCLNGDTTTNPT